MNFLADENVERSVVELLREMNYDVMYITETCAGCTDDKIIKLARSENRVLITNDSDFGEMVFRQRERSAGIILMRFKTEAISKKIQVIKHLLKYHREKLPGHFTVINEHQIKIRPLS